MKYNNKLSITTLLSLPALYVGAVLGALSAVAVCTGDIGIIPVLALISSAIVIVSAIALVFRKHWSLVFLSIGLHSFVGIFALGCILNHAEAFSEFITTFPIVVVPIALLLICAHNQNIRNELNKNTSNPD